MAFRETADDGSIRLTGSGAPMAPGSLLLPPNLRGGRKTAALDLNTAPEAIQPGHWHAGPGSTNLPPGATDYTLGWTNTHDPTTGNVWVTQYAQPMSGGDRAEWAQTWFRRCRASVWQPWRTLEVLPIGYANTYLYRTTNLPNDAIERTTHAITSFGVPPSNAIWAAVTLSVSAHCVANCAVRWRTHITGPDNAWLMRDFYSHNHANAAFDLGRTHTFNVDVRGHVRNGYALQTALNGANDAGSGAWVDVGALHISVTWMGHKTVL